MLRWAACDPDSGAFDGVDADEQLPAASTIKLFVASAFWRSQLEPDELVGEIPPAGSAGLAAYLSPRARLTLGDLARSMLAVSDNAATNVLLDRLGLDAVNEEIARLWLDRTHVRRRMMSDGPENVTTAGDLARGLGALADHAQIRRALPSARRPRRSCPPTSQASRSSRRAGSATTCATRSRSSSRTAADGPWPCCQPTCPPARARV